MSRMKNAKQIVVEDTKETGAFAILRLEPKRKGEKNVYSLNGRRVELLKPFGFIGDKSGYRFTDLEMELECGSVVPYKFCDTDYEGDEETTFLQLYTGPIPVLIKEQGFAAYESELYPSFCSEGEGGETLWELKEQGNYGDWIKLTCDQLPYVPLGGTDYKQSTVEYNERAVTIEIMKTSSPVQYEEVENEKNNQIALDSLAYERNLMKEVLRVLEENRIEFSALIAEGNAGEHTLEQWKINKESTKNVIEKLEFFIKLKAPNSGVTYRDYVLQEGDLIYFMKEPPHTVSIREEGHKTTFYVSPYSNTSEPWKLTMTELIKKDRELCILAIQSVDGTMQVITHSGSN